MSMSNNTFARSEAGYAVPMDNGPSELKRQPEIAGAMERLEKAVVAVRETADMLGSKITPILSPSGPVATDGRHQDKPQPARCDLASAIHERASNLENIASLLGSISNRCEL